MTILHDVRTPLITALMSVTILILSGTATSKEEPKKDLEILTVMTSPSVCIGAELLSIRIVIANRSREAVELDMSRLSTTAGFVALVDTTEMKFRTQTLAVNSDSVGKPSASATTLLPPNGFLEKDLQFPIRDSFFAQAGFYRLNLSSSVRVGRLSFSRDVLSSSSAIFELRACR